MIIREYNEADWQRIVELHKSGVTPEHELPWPSSPLTLIKECAVDGDRVIAAGLARLELNITLMLDHQWSTPHKRLETVLALQESMHQKASAYGLDWAYAEAHPRFGKRLEEFGWIPAKNPLYFLRIH